MKKIFSGRKWHLWVGFILALPFLIVSITAVLIAFEDSYKDKESEPKVNVSWLPGYSQSAMQKEYEMKRGEVKSSLLASDGTMYYGTKTGIITVKNNKAEYLPSFETADVFTIEEVNKTIYIGTKTGLYKYKNGKSEKLFNKETHHLDIHSNGYIAICTNKEMYFSYDSGKTWQKDKTLAQAINTLLVSDKNMLAKTNIPLSKLILDMHTGKAFFGKAFQNIWIILIGFSIFFLTVTGIYMWYVRYKKKIKRSIYLPYSQKIKQLFSRNGVKVESMKNINGIKHNLKKTSSVFEDKKISLLSKIIVNKKLKH